MNFLLRSLRIPAFVALGLAVLHPAAFAQENVAPKTPPPTPRKPGVDVYHGVKVTDDYQWLENWNDPDVRAWSEAQNAYARGQLDRLPAVAEIRERITELELSDAVDYYGLARRGGLLFAMKLQPPKQQPFLVVLKSAADTAGEKVLVDPTQLDAKGTTTIDWFVASPDGKLVAVSLSVGGSESGNVHVYEVATGKEIGEVIPRVNGGTAGGSLAWAHDGSGFYYTRYPRGEERPPADMDFYQQAYFHKLGTKTEDDTYVLGKDFPRIAEIELHASEDGRYILAITQKGDGGEYRFDLLQGLASEEGQAGPHGRTIPLAGFEQQFTKGEFGPEGTLYLLSNKDAPRGKIIRIELPLPGQVVTDGAELLKAAETIVPESEATIQGIAVTQSRLYVEDQIGGPSQLRVFELGGKSLPPVKLPPVAAVNGMVTLDGDDILYRCQTYTEPPAWYQYAASAGESRKTALVKTSPADYSDCEVVREVATSKDGTKIPVNIIHQKGLKLDGNNPTVVWGYGGFGVSESPVFSPRRRVFIEQGGVFAMAVIRGGGEFGEAWHRAGNLTQKQNTFDDFFAACQHMIDAKYTRREKLAIMGGSNGGLLMGATVVQHPELCQAVVSSVGIYDMLRVELSSNGAFNVTEYGTVKDPEQFKALYAYSPYHHVQDGAKYPPILFLTGANDPRVEPWQSRKMTARLQAADPDNLVLLRTSANSGHGIGSSLNERIEQSVDIYAFLFAKLGVKYEPMPTGELK